MAARYPSMLDLARIQDPSGKTNTSAIAMVLSEELPILEDMPLKECNNGTSHEEVLQASLPSGSHRRAYQGVESNFADYTPITEKTVHLEQPCTIDEGVLAAYKRNGTDQAYLQAQKRETIAGMSQHAGSDFIYADEVTDPAEMTGLAPRYNALTLTDKPTANNYLQNVIDAGGTTANSQSSIFLVGWGFNSVFGIYPTGSKLGIDVKDMGTQRVTDSNGNPYYARELLFKWDYGLFVKDWRYVVRIANIDTTVATPVIDYKLLLRAIAAIPNLNGCNPVFYCNRSVKILVDEAAAAKSNVFHTVQNPFGQMMTMINGVPIKAHDSLLNTEAVVV